MPVLLLQSVMTENVGSSRAEDKTTDCDRQIGRRQARHREPIDHLNARLIEGGDRHASTAAEKASFAVL